jgi:hypothetical protein
MSQESAQFTRFIFTHCHAADGYPATCAIAICRRPGYPHGSKETELPDMRIIGHRKEQPIAFSASAELLLQGARFNDEIHRLPTGQRSFIPKGVFRFASHAEANQQQQDCLAKGMAKIALERS